MKKDTKRSKKKVTSKPKTENAARCNLKQGNATDSSSNSSSTTSWTPLQLEQSQLAKELDAYITEFQQKVLRLNFTPSDRELVILFIMNLHPRFRRFVEPAELSCSTWIEAAAFARLHCTRISVMMGCERHDTDPMFKSAESKTLIDSGYFVSSYSPSAIMYPGDESIQHLLTTEASDNKCMQIATSEIENNRDIQISASSPTPENNSKHIQATTKSKSNNKRTQATVSSSSSSSPPEADRHSIQATASSSTAETNDNHNQPTHLDEDSEAKNKRILVADLIEKSEKQRAVDTDIPLTTALSLMDDNAEELMRNVENIFNRPMEIVEEEKLDAKKNKKEKEKDKQYILPRVTAVKSNGSLTNSQSICYRVPKEHSGVNLTFLELEINGRKVKGLLAKLRWGSSAMSLDCIKELGLNMKESNNFCIYTDFGYEDSIGIMTLPIIHPADKRIKSELEIQVLPQIYGGHVDLVLGADFFYFFNPVLNIKTRAIHFLGRETPYIVGTIP